MSRLDGLAFALALAISIVFGPFHYCAFCERATPDAPETIAIRRAAPDVVIGQSAAAPRGSASLPACRRDPERQTRNYLLIGALRSECAA